MGNPQEQPNKRIDVLHEYYRQILYSFPTCTDLPVFLYCCYPQAKHREVLFLCLFPFKLSAEYPFFPDIPILVRIYAQEQLFPCTVSREYTTGVSGSSDC